MLWLSSICVPGIVICPALETPGDPNKAVTCVLPKGPLVAACPTDPHGQELPCVGVVAGLPSSAGCPTKGAIAVTLMSPTAPGIPAGTPGGAVPLCPCVPVTAVAADPSAMASMVFGCEAKKDTLLRTSASNCCCKDSLVFCPLAFPPKESPQGTSHEPFPIQRVAPK